MVGSLPFAEPYMASDVERRLGRQVASYRKAAGLTQEALAERVKVAPETISRLERGTTVPSLKTLERIAEAMGADLKDLFDFQRGKSKADGSLDSLEKLLRNATPEEIELVRAIAAVVLGSRSRARGLERT